MLRAGLPRSPERRALRRFASLCAAGALLLPLGCQINLPMNRLLLNGPPTPGPLSRGLTPPLQLTNPPGEEESEPASSSAVMRTAYKVKADAAADAGTLPAPEALPDRSLTVAAPMAATVNLDTVLRVTYERNGDILVKREWVNESQIALNAAMMSCMPEMLRKDTFKRPVAEATVWRRRAELRKTENEKMRDAANTYFDWLAAQRGEDLGRELIGYEEKVLRRARRLAKTEEPAQVLVEGISAALDAQRQSLVTTQQQAQAAAVKLAYLMGTSGVPAAKEMLEPIDRVDPTVPVAVLVRQAQENGPAVPELEGLIASIQQGIDSARGAQRICNCTGAPLVCGRLQIAQSQRQQAELTLDALRQQLRAGVESSWSAILNGREQIARAADAVKHAKENYRITELRLEQEGPEANRRNNTYNAVLTSIRQLAEIESNYVKAINNYNKAQAQLLLLLGTYPQHPPHAP